MLSTMQGEGASLTAHYLWQSSLLTAGGSLINDPGSVVLLYLLRVGVYDSLASEEKQSPKVIIEELD
jgi:hypothetical protein